MTNTKIHLTRSAFGDGERLLVEQGPLCVSTFTYPTGVLGVRLKSGQLELEMLPFQGQQIWRAKCNGRELGMESVCTLPRSGVTFLETFGGFLQHCGVLAMGSPGPTDKHPLHGELPSAPFDAAWVISGEDKKGTYVGLGGSYKHSAVFGNNYVACPEVRIYADSTLFDIQLTVENLSNVPMELMYMAHINFRSVVDGRLVYSARPTPENVRVRASIPSHIRPKPGYAELLQELQVKPEKHHLLSADFPADPEIVLCIDYLADNAGWAHSMQVHPDGTADYVSHRPDQLPRATRWISRTPDHNSLALVEPGTAEPEGYTAEKKKGNIQILGARESFKCTISAGVLSKPEVEKIARQIASSIERS